METCTRDIVLALRAKIAGGAVIKAYNYQTNTYDIQTYATPAEFYTNVGFPFAALEILQPLLIERPMHKEQKRTYFNPCL